MRSCLFSSPKGWVVWFILLNANSTLKTSFIVKNKRTQTHYLDITGEVSVFEAIAALDAEAKSLGVMLLPGVSFDVVPSDYLAAHLKAQLPTVEE
jgi:short subunit dehydrogenase-like uncharacterized protein